MTAVPPLAPRFTECLDRARAAEDYADVIGELGLAASALLEYHGRVRHEVSPSLARALYLINAAAEEIVADRNALLRDQQERVRAAMRQVMRFAKDADGVFHLMFTEVSNTPDDIVEDLAYCGLRDPDATGAAVFLSHHDALPLTLPHHPVCGECAVKAISHLYTPIAKGAPVPRDASGREIHPVPPVTADELRENESAPRTTSRCPGPPHPGHASSDWTCSYERGTPT